MKLVNRRARWACSALALWSVYGVAEAKSSPEAADAGGPEVDQIGSASGADIVITARRREERLIDVPVAVTVITPQTLERYNSTSLVQIGQLSPNVVLTPSGNGTGASISIRGIGATATDAGVEQTVAINIDGVPIGRGRIITVAQFDLQAVEILKGPQALFFGKNSPGGVISLTSAAPESTLGGYVKAGYEFTANDRFVEGAINIPISSTLLSRFSFRANERQSYIKNTAGPLASPFQPGVILPGAIAPYGKLSNVMGRAQLRWKPSGNFDLTLRGTLAQSKDLNDIPTEGKCSATVHPNIVQLGQVDPHSDCNLDLKSSLGTIPASTAAGFPSSRGGVPYSDVNSQLISATANLGVGKIDLTSVSSYYHYSSLNFAPLGNSVFAYFGGSNDEWNTTYTQELRVNSSLGGPLNFSAGVFYENGDRTFRTYSQLGYLPPDTQGRTYAASARFQTNTSSYSAFGQLRLVPVAGVEIAGGVRWTRDDKNGVIVNEFIHPNNFVPLLPQGVELRHKITDDNWSPEATITWRPQSNVTIYAAYKTGYLAPGIANAVVNGPNATVANTQFGAETVKGGELGVKFQSRDRRINGDITVYRYTFDDLQVASFDPTTVSFVVRNAAKARTQGIEAQGQFKATDHLRFQGIAAYNNAKFLSFPSSTCYIGQTVATGCNASPRSQDVSGKPLPTTPKFSGRLLASYEQPISGDWAIDLTGEVDYRSKYELSLTYSPYTKQSAVTLFNATARLFNSQSGLEFSLIGENILDRRYAISAGDITSTTLGDVYYNVGRPRTVTVQAKYQF
jgi:iron complex outermembrane receptor protein